MAMVTIAAAMATIAEPMSVLDRPPPPTANFINWGVDRIYNGPCNGNGHGNGYDHDCCGSAAAAGTTSAMVTIVEAMDTNVDPMSVSDRPRHPPAANFMSCGVISARLDLHTYASSITDREFNLLVFFLSREAN